MENAAKRFNWLELNGFFSAKLCQLKKTSRKIPRVVLNPPWKKKLFGQGQKLFFLCYFSAKGAKRGNMMKDRY